MLQQRDEDLEKTTLFLKYIKESRKELFDNKNRIRIFSLIYNNIILLYNTKLEKSYSYKLVFRQLSPFRIAKAFANKRLYILKEFNEARIKGTMISNRLKRFYYRIKLKGDQSSISIDN